MAISRLIYQLSMLSTPSLQFTRVKDKMYEFIWNSKRYKIKRTIMNQEYKIGGFKMIKVKVLLLYSAARPDSFSSTLQPYPWQEIHPTWSEPSPWGDQSRWAAYIPCRLAPSFCPPYVASHNFTPLHGEACMEFTSCPRMLHGQPTGSTEIWTPDLHIQSPTH